MSNEGDFYRSSEGGGKRRHLAKTACTSQNQISSTSCFRVSFWRTKALSTCNYHLFSLRFCWFVVFFCHWGIAVSCSGRSWLAPQAEVSIYLLCLQGRPSPYAGTVPLHWHFFLPTLPPRRADFLHIVQHVPAPEVHPD